MVGTGLFCTGLDSAGGDWVLKYTFEHQRTASAAAAGGSIALLLLDERCRLRRQGASLSDGIL